MHFCICVMAEMEMKFEHGPIGETGVAVQCWLWKKVKRMAWLLSWLKRMDRIQWS